MKHHRHVSTTALAWMFCIQILANYIQLLWLTTVLLCNCREYTLTSHNWLLPHPHKFHIYNHLFFHYYTLKKCKEQWIKIRMYRVANNEFSSANGKTLSKLCINLLCMLCTYSVHKISITISHSCHMDCTVLKETGHLLIFS